MKFYRTLFRRRSVSTKEGGVLGRGFSVRFLGVLRLRYTEGDHNVTLAIEPAVRDIDWAIPMDSIRKWDTPYDHETLSWDQIEAIKRNVARALDFMHVRTGGAPLA
jgi:hypothetical protein